MKHPCKDCEKVGETQDKNNETCKDCPDRINYVKGIDRKGTFIPFVECLTPDCHEEAKVKEYCLMCYSRRKWRLKHGKPLDDPVRVTSNRKEKEDCLTPDCISKAVSKGYCIRCSNRRRARLAKGLDVDGPLRFKPSPSFKHSEDIMEDSIEKVEQGGVLKDPYDKPLKMNVRVEEIAITSTLEDRCESIKDECEKDLKLKELTDKAIKDLNGKHNSCMIGANPNADCMVGVDPNANCITSVTKKESVMANPINSNTFSKKLSLNLERHVDILSFFEARANKELRTLENQIIWSLKQIVEDFSKNGLNNKKSLEKS